MLSCYFCHIRRLVLDQSSPVNPVSAVGAGLYFPLITLDYYIYTYQVLQRAGHRSQICDCLHVACVELARLGEVLNLLLWDEDSI